jgi:mono/diheme cytochrome c family protein
MPLAMQGRVGLVGRRRLMTRAPLIVVAALAAMTVPASRSLRAADAQVPTTASAPAAQATAVAPRATVDRYCVTCHNQRLKTAGLMLDQLNVNDIGGHADVWEKVLRKLRSGQMPPGTAPRPPKETYDSLSAWLEAELDRAGTARPNPGRTAVHRLNRTEYQNVIRDLLALDIDASTLLPGDDAAFGFDNIADLLKVSPDLLDSYLMAANKISRLAVGDPAVGLGSVSYNVSKTATQINRADEELPFGSRGGAAIRHYFPYDGEYLIRVRVVGTARPAATVEVRIDNSLTAALPSLGRTGEEPSDKNNVETRAFIKAGPRVVGVSLRKDTLEAETRFPEIYPWGNSAIFGTTVGAVNFIKINAVDISGPFKPAGPGDTPSRRRVFTCQPATPAAEDACAEKIFTGLARRAFRRPVTASDVTPFMEAYSAEKKGATFEAGIRAGLEQMLVAPALLFRIQRDPADAKPDVPFRLSDIDLASRLSFFLWSSMPDEELLQVAERGRLKEPAVMEQQVRRMLADDRAAALVTNFATQWLYLRNLKGLVPDLFQFPDWDDDLRISAARETELFLENQLRQDRSVLDLMTANYSFLDERLAKHYGVPGVYGSRFRRVTFADGRRAGLLGHASILAVTSQPNRTSPVQRGKWVLENLLGTPPPPPPPDVPDLPSNDKEQPKTIRERMEKHRTNSVCAGCHATMDPLGFALESFDAIGTFRTVADGHPVDTKSALPDGTRVDGPEGLRQLVETRRAQYLETVTEKLLTYALGRGTEYYDMPTVRKIVREAAQKNFTWSSLILGITTSTPFQMSVRRAQS